MPDYRIRSISTTDQGTLIHLHVEDKQKKDLPAIVTIFDRNNNGLDAGDLVVSHYDLAYQLPEVGRLLMQKGATPPKRIGSADVIQELVGADGGISTKRTVTDQEIKQWGSWLNPYLKLARSHRQLLKAKAKNVEIKSGQCLVYEEAPCPHDDRTPCTTLHEKGVRFSPPLRPITKKAAKVDERERSVIRSRTEKPIIVDPGNCDEARARLLMEVGARKALLHVKSGDDGNELLTWMLLNTFGLKQKTATLFYRWNDDPKANLSKAPSMWMAAPWPWFVVEHLNLASEKQAFLK